jgi:thymidylate synthase ThyX
MFFDKLIEKGVPIRDAAYMIPRNTLTRNVEKYDLVNLLDLEMPLRLCETCEPERHSTSWKKRSLIAKAIPEISYFLEPKCGVGFCTEGDYCNHIKRIRSDYNEDLHKETKEAMLGVN